MILEREAVEAAIKESLPVLDAVIKDAPGEQVATLRGIRRLLMRIASPNQMVNGDRRDAFLAGLLVGSIVGKDAR